MTIVVDASVVAKWFVPEDRGDIARRWLESDMTFAAPDLLVLEIANVLSRKMKLGFLDDVFCAAALRSLREGEIELVPALDLVDRGFSLSRQLGHAVYDCIYLALAESRGAVLITDDGKFRSKVLQTGLRHLVGDFDAGPAGPGGIR